jgi:hypothetical protein
VLMSCCGARAPGDVHARGTKDGEQSSAGRLTYLPRDCWRPACPLVNALALLAPLVALLAAIKTTADFEEDAIAALGDIFGGRRTALYHACRSQNLA